MRFVGVREMLLSVSSAGERVALLDQLLDAGADPTSAEPIVRASRLATSHINSPLRSDRHDTSAPGGPNTPPSSSPSRPSHALPSRRAQSRVTACHIAARLGDAACLSRLLAAGADPQAQDSTSNRTPLHDASFGGSAACVRVLLEAGAAVDARCSSVRCATPPVIPHTSSPPSPAPLRRTDADQSPTATTSQQRAGSADAPQQRDRLRAQGLRPAAAGRGGVDGPPS